MKTHVKQATERDGRVNRRFSHLKKMAEYSRLDILKKHSHRNQHHHRTSSTASTLFHLNRWNTYAVNRHFTQANS